MQLLGVDNNMLKTHNDVKIEPDSYHEFDEIDQIRSHVVGDQFNTATQKRYGTNLLINCKYIAYNILYIELELVCFVLSVVV